MKLPINFNDSYPLTLGVSDDYFTLATRLKRLKRAPMQPRRATTWLVCAALLISFAAVMPLRLTARAQSEAASAKRSARVNGTLLDSRGRPVAGARVNAMAPFRNGDEPLETVVSGADGKFAFSSKVGEQSQIWVDAGARGMARYGGRFSDGTQAPLVMTVVPAARATLQFVGANSQPIVGLKVSLRRVGPTINSWSNVPRQTLRALKATTDARGAATFGPLPAGLVAQFQIDARQAGNRGISTLDIDDLIKLEAPQTQATIRLLPTVALAGRVFLPDRSSAEGATVIARRISDFEAKSGGAGESTSETVKTDARGNYRIAGLRPGNYDLTVMPATGMDAVVPYTRRENVGVRAPLNRVNFALQRGALVQGVVVSQQTGRPVKGQTMGLDGNGYAITDARGYFRFRTIAGAQRLYVHANGSNSPPPGYFLPAKSEFKFALANGEKREFKIALPTVSSIKPVRGVVVDASGQSVAGATVRYGSLEWSNRTSKTVATDARGRFELPALASKNPLQLLASRGDAVTLNSTIAVEGSNVRLQLADNAWASIAGRVTDENARPLANAKVQLYTFIGRVGSPSEPVTTDAQGNYRFDQLQPNISTMIELRKDGYSFERELPDTLLKAGQTRRFDATLTRLNQNLGGIVIDKNGQPARGFRVWVGGQERHVTAASDGRFYFPQVASGAVKIYLVSPKSGEDWKPVTAQGGDKNVRIRVAQLTPIQSFAEPQSGVKPEALIGKMAPPIQATKWSGGRALSLQELRGKKVLLFFNTFAFGDTNVARDFARSSPQVQVIGVQITAPEFFTAGAGQREVGADEAARQMGFPIAVDAALPARKSLGWQTARSYGNASYAVIGRDGKVLYAGNSLERAIEKATSK